MKENDFFKKKGFDKEGYTYILIGLDSFSIKEELKDAGWKYDPQLRWHSDNPEGYENNVTKLHWTELYAEGDKGEFYPLKGTQEKIDALIAAAKPESISEWIGEEGDKITDLKVKLVSIHGFQSKYGFSQVVKFITEEGSILTWFTAVDIKIAEGEPCLLNGTIKKLDTYNGDKITVMTRCKLKVA